MTPRAKNSIALTLRPATFGAGLSVATGWLLADCMEFRGKQDLYIRQKPEVLDALRAQAVIQSVESSNRIEGVVVDPGRLRPLVVGRARPRDRSEEELSGYRRALDWVFSRRPGHPIDTRTILHLHKMSQGGTSGDAGRLKAKDNEIVELRPGVGRVMRFRPTSARQTPAAMRLLCERYRDMTRRGDVPPLLMIPTFVFDFLCIHPFRDGNGRVSRLLTTLLLQQHGFSVAKYISLERLIEQTREDYYRVLAACSLRWSDGLNEISPWWNYFLTIVRRSYLEFSQEVESAESRGGKSDLARRTILTQAGPFTLADIRALIPGVSPQLVKKVLAVLKREHSVSLTGRGRGARWEVRHRVRG
jgi:Fic family protein